MADLKAWSHGVRKANLGFLPVATDLSLGTCVEGHTMHLACISSL